MTMLDAPDQGELTFDVPSTLRTIAVELNDIFYERKQMIHALILGLLSGHHVYVIGEVGTGKTDTITELVRRLLGCRYFGALLSRTRPDAAILGPYDLPKLASTGEFVRRNKGYLTDADVPFLDEIGKIGATLGHDLLGALNERQMHQVEVHDDGTVTTVKPIPLHSAFTASNEALGTEDDVQALWDRLLIRVKVDYIAEPGNFVAFLAGRVGNADRNGDVTTIPFEAVQEAAVTVVPFIPVQGQVFTHMWEIRQKLEAAGIVLSTRRWGQTIRVMQANAYYYGRTEVTAADLSVLDLTAWHEPEQIKTVQRVRADVADPLTKEVLTISDDLAAIRKVVMEQEGKALTQKAGVGVEETKKLDILLRDDLAKLAVKFAKAGLDPAPLEQLHANVHGLRKLIARICLEQGDLEGL